MCIYDLLPGSSWAYNKTKAAKNNERDGRTRLQICLDAISRVLDGPLDDDDDGVRLGACDPVWYPGFHSRRHSRYWTEEEDDEDDYYEYASQADDDEEEEANGRFRAEFGHETEGVWPLDRNSSSYWVENGATRTIAEGIRWPSHVQSRLGKWTASGEGPSPSSSSSSFSS